MPSPTITPVQKKMNKLLTIVAWSFVAIAAIALLWFYVFNSRHITTNDAQVKQYITPVASKVTGYINEIRFEENQYVHAGDTLIVIDNRELKQDIAIASADLDATANSVTVQNLNVDTRKSNTSIIKAQIEAASVEVATAKLDYDRYKNLVAERAATQQQLDHIEAKYKQAQAGLQALQEQLQAVQISVAAEASKIAPVQNQVSQRRANLEKANIKYQFSYVLAPYDGYVGTKNIQVGQFIKEGQALVQVVSQEKWIVANFKESQLEGIEIGRKVEIKADAFSKTTFTGIVQSFSPAAGAEFALVKPNNATGNFVKIEQRFPVKIILDTLPQVEKLKTGMNVTVAVEK